jgi:hypothetical protein
MWRLAGDYQDIDGDHDALFGHPNLGQDLHPSQERMIRDSYQSCPRVLVVGCFCHC